MKNIRLSMLITLFCFSSFIAFAQTITSLALIGKAENNKSWDYPSESTSLQADIVVDKDNNIIYCDRVHNQVKKIDRITGAKSIVAGTGIPGFSGDGGLAVNAQISFPISLAFDRLGNLYISDRDNHRVRKIDVNTKIMSTIVGDGYEGFKGDGGLAKNASLNFPMGICIDTINNMLFIADTYNYVVRRVNMSTNIIQTIAGQANVPGFAGDGSSAVWTSRLKLPSDVAVDKQGNIYIDDMSNSRIRKVTAATGIINTIVGGGPASYNGDSILALSAYLPEPLSISIDENGNLYIAEISHNRIRKFDAMSNKLYHVAGNSYKGGHYGDGGLAKDAGIKLPSGVFYNSMNKELLFADNDNSKIRLISNTQEAPTAESLQEICRLTESAMPKAVGANLLWYNNPLGGIGSSVTPLINTSVIDTNTYFVSQTIAGKESLRKAITVVVIKYDSGYFYYPSLELCNKTRSFDAVSHFVPEEFSDYVHFSTNPFFTDTFDTSLDNLLYTSKFTIYAKTINDKGCKSPTYSTNIIIKEQVPMPKFDPIVNICQWDPLFSPKAEGNNLSWSCSFQYGNSATPPELTTGSVKTVYYYVRQGEPGVFGNCYSEPGTIMVTVNPKPKEYAQVKSPVEYCQGDVAEKFFAIGSNLSWFSEDSIFLGTETPKPSTKEAGKTKTLVCVQNEYGCKGFISTITTIIKPKPTINSTFDLLKPFAGLPITLNCSSDIGKTFIWNTGDTQTSLIYTPKNEGRHFFWVQSTSELGCKSDTIWHYVDITPSKYWESDYEVFPNPFVNRIHLSNINLNDIMSVNLYSLNGIKVFQSEMPLKSLEVNIPDWLLSGMYLLEVNTVGRANPTRLVYKK